MTAKTSALSAVLEFVQAGAREAKLLEARIGELNLLVEEALVNVCRHAYPDHTQGSMTVTWSIPAPGELRVEIADQGVAFNPLLADAPDLTLNLERRPVGGIGIFLLKRFANSLTYCRENGWNRLTFGVSGGS
jgi:serine/threonine-protein kinase RsbW